MRLWILAAMVAGAACGPSTTTVGGGRGGGNGSGGGTGTGGGAGGGSAGGPGTGGGSAAGGGTGGGAGGFVCTGGLCTQVASCPGNGDTTLSGTVYDPAGKVPLYNVAVYIPNAALDPVPDGASCDRCAGSLSGSPITHALTDSSGNFTLTGVPAGTNIPLVLQVGKWRRQVAIPSVTACVPNAVTDCNLTRLPRNRGEGSIPKIAIATGGADTLECLPRRMGLDDSEFGLPGSAARIQLFAGQPTNGLPPISPQATTRFAPTLNGGAAFPAASTLWASAASLRAYDLVLLSCEGDEFTSEKPATALAAMDQFSQAGGRLFATHFHEYFLRMGPAPWPSAGGWTDPYLQGSFNTDAPMDSTVVTTFPKGLGFSQWLQHVGASTAPSTLRVAQVRYNLSSVNPTYGQDWVRVPNFATGQPQPDAVLYASFNTPLGALEANQCGRAVFSGLHVAAATLAGEPADDAGYGYPFPQGCRMRDLTPQEKAMEFMLFDLSSCVQSDNQPPAIN